MAMAPIPVVALLVTAISVELTIVSVPLAKVYAVGTVFAVIPFMIIAMIAIVVTGMIAASGNHYFLGGGLRCCRSSKRGSQEKKT
jgi:hypothetical protein